MLWSRHCLQRRSLFQESMSQQNAVEGWRTISGAVAYHQIDSASLFSAARNVRGACVCLKTHIKCERGCWHDPLSAVTSARVLSAAGVVAIALALAGAEVVAADLPCVTPLARANAAANCRAPPHRIQARAATVMSVIAVSLFTLQRA